MAEEGVEREIGRRRRVEALQANERNILRMIATGCSLKQVLNALVHAVEMLFPPSICILLVHEERSDCLRIGSASDLDQEIRSVLDGIALDPALSSFSAAAHSHEMVIVTDIKKDDRCGATREAALRSGFRSCWAHPVVDPEGELLGVIGMYNHEARAPTGEELEFIISVSDLMAIAIGHEHAEQRMRLLASALEQTDDGVVIMDIEGVIEFANQAYGRITGSNHAEVIGENIPLANMEFHESNFDVELWNTILDGKAFRDVFVNRRSDGELYYEEKTITPFKDEQENVTHFVATGKDITQHIRIQQRLNYLAHHDALTGLANRALLTDHLEKSLAQAKREECLVTLMYLDLDRFKMINDGLGHSVGDRLLKIIAERLRHSLRESDTVARMGGDEFVILLPNTRHVDEAAHVAQNLLDVIHVPVTISSEQDLVVTASIGITIYPIDGEDADTLLRNADLAMYRAKSRPGGAYEFYAQYMTVQTGLHMDMENKLRLAIEHNEISLHYQPRIDSQTGEINAIEALLRWSNPDLGEVAPKDFIPVLEVTGLITLVGRWTVKTACQYVWQLHQAGYDKLRVSINLSPRQLRDDGFAMYVQECLEEFGLSGDSLEFEITESIIIDGVGAAISMLTALHDLGAHISVDEFGTGYSSLAYLKRFPIDRLKIGRTFVHDITGNDDYKAIVSAIISMANALGYQTTAEGVETPEQAELLRRLGSDEQQGFYFSKPLHAVHLEEWITRH